MDKKNDTIDFGTALLTGGRDGLRNVLIFNIITHAVPAVSGVVGSIVKGIVRRNVEKHVNKLSNITTKQRTSSIRLHRDFEKEHSSNTLFDAVIAYVSELPQTKHVKRTAMGVFIMSTDDEIEISSGIFVKKVRETIIDERLANLVIDVYSYDYDLITLRKFIEEIEEKYNMALANQLGKNIFYFDEIPISLPLRLDKTPDLSKAPKNLMFSSFVLHTNKSLKNLYGDSVRLIRKRVQFFLNNKRWYEDKGVPYTLGLLLHGVPGAGKTSTIKSIAKDTNRHVLNIKLNTSTTVSQLNNLFYSSQVHVLQNGVNKVYDIPIDKRIIVLEDVDCLTDVVLQRSSATSDKNKTKLPISNNAIDSGIPMDYNNSSDSEKLTLSTILNILDGVLEQPGRILIMTSNHPEKLDKALLRPGRIDVIVHFDYCKKHEIKEIVEAFADVEVKKAQEANFVEGLYTPAEVTQVIFECMDNHTAMIEKLSTPKVENCIVFDTGRENLNVIDCNQQKTSTEKNNTSDNIANIENATPCDIHLKKDETLKTLHQSLHQEWQEKQKAIYDNRNKPSPTTKSTQDYVDDFQQFDGNSLSLLDSSNIHCGFAPWNE